MVDVEVIVTVVVVVDVVVDGRPLAARLIGR
jgi:hypothetical protein